MSSDSGASDVENELPTKHPLRRRFCQQRQKGWRPVLTSRGSIILFAAGTIFGVIFGVLFILLNAKSHEYEVRYDDSCPVSENPCPVQIDIKEDMKGTVKLQYKLTSFHQNHRRLIFSRLYYQLIGDFVDFDGMVNAKPYRSINDSPEMKNWILPSGAFAWFAFNDTISWTSTKQTFDENKTVYPEEQDFLFQPLNEKYTEGFKWIDNHSVFTGMTDPHFIVWMRTSAELPVVKDWGICENCEIPKGRYQIEIQSNYPTDLFDGEKYVVVTEMTALGDRSASLGIAYCAFAGVCFVCALVMVIAELAAPRKMGLE